MEKVVIMMSTYNGEKYLGEQLDSLLNLEKNNFDIYFAFRDDGSKDDTINIIKNFCNKNKNTTWYQGENLKPAKSFWELMSKQEEFDYFAFCDQDDVWDSKKIKVSIDKLSQVKGKPAIYFSAVNIVDKDMNFISKKKLTMMNSFENSFLQNPAIGCTVVFNKKMKEYLDKLNISGEIGMHDSLIYRIAQTIEAEIIYDENAYISYRQHDNNVIGITTRKSVKDYINYVVKPQKKFISNVAKLIYDTYFEEIKDDYKRKILKQFIDLSNEKNILVRLKIIFNSKFNANNFKQNIRFRYDILMNRR